jgi:peptidyl-prolyl cis-trans isomerase D
MMKFLRSQSQTVLIVILGVIGLGFLFYGNSGSFLTTGGNTQTDFGRIEGQDLQVADLWNAVRDTRNLLALEGHDCDVTQAQLAETAWEQLLALHEADRLHIDISDAQLVAYIQSLPMFQKDGAYDPDLYRTAMNNLQNSHHISPDTFTAIIHNQMRTEALRKTLFSTVHGSGGDADDEYSKDYGPATISYVTFPAASYAASAKVTPDEIAAAYKADPNNPAYRTDEQRQVEYVLFPLSAEQARLPEQQKQAAIEALGNNQALDFALALQPDPNAPNTAAAPPADFDAEAKKRGLTPVTTNFFPVGKPPAGMPPSPAFNNAAFALSKEDPISKVVQVDNGVVVIRLLQVQASQPKPLAEVSPAVEHQLKAQKGVLAQKLAAGISATMLRDAMKKGASFAAAAAAQHLTVQTQANLVPRNVSMNDERLATLAYYSTTLPVGSVSDPIPVPTDDSVIVLHVDSRAPADPAGKDAFAKQFHERRDDDLRAAAFLDWVNWQSKQPGTHRPPNLEAYGAVE